MTAAIAVLIACHNRRAKTVACLRSVLAQTADASFHPIIFDDGSTDGTADAIRDIVPGARIIAGRGDAFWAGGMRAAFDVALEGDFDYALWLNDDVVLAPDAVARLLDTAIAVTTQEAPLALVGGALADPKTGLTAYHGVIRRSRRHPFRFARCEPARLEARACDTLHGNVVLVPRATALAVGSIDPAYIHTLGDLDYGLRVRRAGGWVGLAPGHLGWCSPNSVEQRWFNPALPLGKRWRIVGHPLGFPFRPWLHFVRAHGGALWVLHLPKPYWRLVVPPTWAAMLSRLRAGLIGRRHHARAS